MGNINRNTDKPSICHARNRSRHDFPTETQCLAHSNPAQIGNANTVTVHSKLIIGETETVMNSFPAKFWIPGTSCKKITKSLTQLNYCHLRSIFGHFQHPGKLLFLDLVQLPTQSILRRFGQSIVSLPLLILSTPFRQCPIVGKTGNTGSFGKVRCLNIVGIKCYSMGYDHVSDSSTVFFIPSSNFLFLLLREP